MTGLADKLSSPFVARVAGVMPGGAGLRYGLSIRLMTMLRDKT